MHKLKDILECRLKCDFHLSWRVKTHSLGKSALVCFCCPLPVIRRMRLSSTMDCCSNIWSVMHVRLDYTIGSYNPFCTDELLVSGSQQNGIYSVVGRIDFI